MKEKHEAIFGSGDSSSRKAVIATEAQNVVPSFLTRQPSSANLPMDAAISSSRWATRFLSIRGYEIGRNVLRRFRSVRSP
jgi:hypothetical protein